MKVEERREQIYNVLRVNGEISVDALSKQFKVSAMTIRRDLDSLERSNLINRTYGKAHITNKNRQEFSFDYRYHENLGLKQKIAATALELLKDVSSIYVDGSSTAAELLKIFSPRHTCTIFTNSLQALKIICENPRVRPYVIGGFLGPDHNTFDDETSISIAKQIFVDATITSCSCFSKTGVFNDGMTGTQIRRIMTGNSSHNYLLADHTKANSQGLFLLNTWDSVHTLITDQPLEQDLLTTLQQARVDVHWQ
ncbi:MAG: DeoR/GlpR family DNA-binding transcription regulator [Lachnospiraceae bacterium]|nr:DeoR/GlpR family DNA-binding transcription regulator [Lachnospiraceae bacterium]